MADSKNLPTNHLAPNCSAQFIRTMAGEAVSLKEAARLSTLPLPVLKQEIVTRQLRLGGPLTQAECDAGLAMLAAAGLPRAATGGHGDAVRALYLELLRDAGVTGSMFKAACRAYIMRPAPEGKTKFFPDPGQLAALCADDIADRKRQLAALTGAMALLDGPPVAPEPEITDEVIAKRRADLEAVTARLSARPSVQTKRTTASRSVPGVSGAEMLASRDPAAVERLRAMQRAESA